MNIFLVIIRLKYSLIHRSNREETEIHLYIISNTRRRHQQSGNGISKTYNSVKIFGPLEVANAADEIRYALAELITLSKMQYLILTSKSTCGMIA